MKKSTARQQEPELAATPNVVLEGQDGVQGPGSIRMDKLDGLAAQHLSDRLLHPERLAEMLQALASRRAERMVAVYRGIAGLEKEAPTPKIG